MDLFPLLLEGMLLEVERKKRGGSFETIREII